MSSSERYGLLRYFAFQKGPACTEEIAWAFEKLCLPAPEKSEYLSTAEGGAVVLLDPYGAALRITSPKHLETERPFLKRTFLVHQFPAGDLAIQVSLTASKEAKKEGKRERGK